MSAFRVALLTAGRAARSLRYSAILSSSSSIAAKEGGERGTPPHDPPNPNTPTPKTPHLGVPPPPTQPPCGAMGRGGGGGWKPPSSVLQRRPRPQPHLYGAAEGWGGGGCIPFPPPPLPHTHQSQPMALNGPQRIKGGRKGMKGGSLGPRSPPPHCPPPITPNQWLSMDPKG